MRPKWALQFLIWTLVFPAWMLASACGGSTTPTGPSIVEQLQPSSATISLSGSVRDAGSGAGIGGVDVQIAGGPDLTKSTTTDPSGNYTMTGLRVGVYPVRFSRPGFETVERQLNALQDARLDVQLRQGGSCMAPPAPTNLRATVSGTRVTFTWTAAPSATNYLLVAGTSPGGSNTLTFQTTLTRYEWRSAARATQYARVFARTDCVHDTPSNEVTFTVN
jgi:hypothetical protein